MASSSATIEIKAIFKDKTNPGLNNAIKRIDKFQNSIKKTELQMQKLVKGCEKFSKDINSIFFGAMKVINSASDDYEFKIKKITRVNDSFVSSLSYVSDELSKVFNLLSIIKDDTSSTFNIPSAGPYAQLSPRTLTKNANGNIITGPVISMVGEEGPEAIIPLSKSRRERGLSLWKRTGEMLGVTPFANGGIVGAASNGAGRNPYRYMGIQDADYMAYKQGKITEKDLIKIAQAAALYNAAGGAGSGQYHYKNSAHDQAANIRKKYDSDYVKNDTYDRTHGGKHDPNTIKPIPGYPKFEMPTKLYADTHQDIINSSKGLSPEKGTEEWSIIKFLKWFADYKIRGGKYEKIEPFKDQWISGYKDTIKAAAKKYDIPEVLLAGVAHNEVGGKPLMADDAIYGLRSIPGIQEFAKKLPIITDDIIYRLRNIPGIQKLAKKVDISKFSRYLRPVKENTSFGNTSVQVLTAAETLGYDIGHLTAEQQKSTINSVKDPVQGIFVSAKHLSDLRDSLYDGKQGKDLTDADMSVIATRYNRSDLSTLEYGENVISRKSKLENLLSSPSIMINGKKFDAYFSSDGKMYSKDILKIAKEIDPYLSYRDHFIKTYNYEKGKDVIFSRSEGFGNISVNDLLKNIGIDEKSPAFSWDNSTKTATVSPIKLFKGDPEKLTKVNTSGVSVSVSDAMALSEDSYHVNMSDRGKNRRREIGANWDLINVYSPGGLKIAVYGRINSDGQVEYVIANKGSSTPGNWITNLQQQLGWSKDSKRSIAFARMFANDNPDAKVTYVGHSKGGAEALLNGLATNKDAIVINPAKANPAAYGLNESNYTKGTAYILEGEIATSALGMDESLSRNYINPYEKSGSKWWDNLFNYYVPSPISDIIMYKKMATKSNNDLKWWNETFEMPTKGILRVHPQKIATGIHNHSLINTIQEYENSELAKNSVNSNLEYEINRYKVLWEAQKQLSENKPLTKEVLEYVPELKNFAEDSAYDNAWRRQNRRLFLPTNAEIKRRFILEELNNRYVSVKKAVNEAIASSTKKQKTQGKYDATGYYGQTLIENAKATSKTSVNKATTTKSSSAKEVYGPPSPAEVDKMFMPYRPATSTPSFGLAINANGSIIEKPVVALMGEAGPEAIIPLSSNRRERGLSLWQKAGEMLGVKPFADGGIVGASSTPAWQANDDETAASPREPVNTNVISENNPSVSMPVNIGGVNFTISMSNNSGTQEIVQSVKEKASEIANILGEEMAKNLAKVFANLTPQSGGM